MATVVLFHSALGRRPAVEGFAELLRADGHTVHTPDLFAGRVFDEVEAGVAERDRIGIPTLLERASAAVEGLPAELVLVGLSMGAGAAQLLAATRPGARGAVLIQGALPLAALGMEAWPADVALQLHHSPGDPWQDEASVRQLAAEVPEELVEVHDYPGTGHLFLDDDLAAHDAAATERLQAAVRTWVAARERTPRG